MNYAEVFSVLKKSSALGGGWFIGRQALLHLSEC